MENRPVAGTQPIGGPAPATEAEPPKADFSRLIQLRYIGKDSASSSPKWIMENSSTLLA
jgi:hypothetical protein